MARGSRAATMTHMTESDGAATTQTPHPSAPGPGARPALVRPRHGRMVLGVCAGLGHTTDVDPVIYRVLFVVLTIFGGLGLVVYGLAWLFIPEEGSGLSEVERLLRRHRHGRHPGLLGLVIA